MANALFDKGREGFLDGTIDWDTDDIRVILYDETDDATVIATDDNLDDKLAGGRVAVSGSLASKTVVDGVADAADVVLTAVSGDPCESIIGYQHTGTDSTSRLIFFIDTATGLPITPNGSDITIQWDAGANRIFKL